MTFRNCENYPAFSVFHFQSKDDAISYMHLVEPITPLISRRGGQPAEVFYDAYVDWKIAQGLKDYDYRKCYQPGGANPRHIIMQTRKQLLDSENRIKETLGSPTA